jgi:hypothetical protein
VIGESVRSVVIQAEAAIGGSLVGAAGSIIGICLSVRHQDRCDLMGKVIARREAPYSDFTGKSARLLVDAMQRNAPDLHTLLPIYALLSRIRLSSSQPVLQTAEEVLKTLLRTYSEPNVTVEQIEYQVVDGHRDPLRKFSDIYSRRAGFTATTDVDSGGTSVLMSREDRGIELPQCPLCARVEYSQAACISTLSLLQC